MKMLKFLPNVTKRILHRQSVITCPHRYFLSETYNLENAWKDRLQSPILKKINISDLFYELDNQFQHYGYASALDVDLFVNAIDNDLTFDEVEEVVHKLRLSPEAVNLLPSTPHALIRLYMHLNKTDDLLRILDDRLNYGIFPDDYCSIFMMDTFIKSGNFRDAAKISSLSMLQEDVSNPLIKYLSLYSCHKYLENPVPWNVEVETETLEEEDDEVIKVRVKYIRNPYFDDHFDIVDPDPLIGKTLAFIGSEIDDHVGRTYKLIGLLLHDKIENAKEFISFLSTLKENIIVSDGLNIANEILEKKLKIEGKDSEYQRLVSDAKDLLNKSFSTDYLSEGKVLNIVEDRLKDLVKQNEAHETDKQLQLYKEWEKTRENLLMEQLARINKEKQLAEIAHQKQLLQEKEEELFFFDNENKLDLIIEEKEIARQKRVEKEKEIERIRLKLEPVGKSRLRKPGKKDIVLPLESFYDENIPNKLIKTKL